MYELHKEKHKLHKQIRMKEEELEQDWEWLKEKCSPRNMVRELMNRAYCASGTARKMMVGFNSIRSLFGGGRAHRSGCGCED